MSELSVGQLKGLPVNNNVITVPSGHTLYPPGHIIQTINSVTLTQTATSSVAPVATALSATITPRFVTSKILITFSGQIYVNQTGKYARGHIYRGATQISNANGFVSTYGGASDNVNTVSFTISDSPNTTSTTVYTFYISNANGGTATVYAPIDNNYMTLTLMEIAA